MNFVGMRQRIIGALIGVGVVSLIVASIYAYSKHNSMYDETVQSSQERLHTILHQRLKKKEDIGITNVLGFASNGTLIEALHSQERDTAYQELKKIGAFYKENSNFKGIKVHLHDKTGNSFLRSWKFDKYGDNLNHREAITTIQNSQKAAITYEVDELGFMIRGVAPVMKDGSYLGSIEFLQGVGSVSRDFKKEGRRFVLLLNENAQVKSAKVAKNTKVDTYALANNKWFDKETIAYIKSIDLEQLQEDGYVIDDTFFSTFLPAKDSQGNEIGLYVVAEPIEAFNATLQNVLSVAYSYIGLIVMIILFVVIVLSFIVNVVTQNLIQMRDLSEELASGKGEMGMRWQVNLVIPRHNSVQR
jgi:methyl-accepting chemotaxis protein